MNCCGQISTSHPSWVSAEKKVALGVDADGTPTTGQWFYYTGLRSGAVRYDVMGKGYQAGRQGRSRFVGVELSHVEQFTRQYSSEFMQLGDMGRVTLNHLVQPTLVHDFADFSERALKKAELARTGDVIAASPNYLMDALGLTMPDARQLISSMRVAVGWSAIV